MFGFGKTKEEMIKKQQTDDDYAMQCYAEGGMHSLFGTSNPKKINQQMRKYMPELMNTIKVTKETTENIEKHVLQQGENLLILNENNNGNHKEVMKELAELKKQNEEIRRENQKLQEKYNALVERMAAYIERDGRGR
jgi:molecular chaperone GrpE (heat shock protein)